MQIIPSFPSVSWRHSLVFRCVMYVALLSFLIAACSGYLLINYQNQKSFKNREENVDIIMNVIAGSLGIAVWNFDTKAALESLESLKQLEGFCGARVLDKNRQLFAQYEWNRQADTIAKEGLGDTNTHDFKLYHIEQSIIYFSDPHSSSDKPEIFGFVEMCDNHSFIKEIIRAQAFQMGWAAVAITLLISCILLIALRKAFLPLASLGEAMASTRSGLHKIDKDTLLGPNEVGELGKQFNAMIENLIQTQQQLEYKISEAQEANRAKSLFLSNMSHELRTPMHAILNYSEMGQKQLAQGDTEKLSKYLTNIQTAGKRLLYLLNDLLDFSKLQAGKMALELACTSIDKIVEYSASELESLFHKKHLQFVLENKAADTLVTVDIGRLTQVFVNLFSNAIKYSPENNSIRVRISDDSYYNAPALHLAFTNNGPHIPSKDIETIFDAFVQSASISNAGGTGLGLAICREIVQSHGGCIWAENLQPVGVTFHILLPRKTKSG